MANFSTNQAKQLYVATALKASNAHVAASDTVGTLAVPFAAAADEFYVEQNGYGGIVRSDLIETAHILSATAVKAANQTERLNSAYVACDSVAAGQQYILKVNVRQFAGMSDEDTLCILADYQAKSGDTAAEILSELAIVLAKNNAKLAESLFNVYVVTAAAGTGDQSSTATKVLPTSSASAIKAGVVGLLIEAAPQAYRRGIISQDNVFFSVTASKIAVSGVDTVWYTVTYNKDYVAAALPNSKKIADLEYFCMGERADIYRGMGFPNSFDTQYLADPESTTGYDVITIHYAYKGENEAIQESDKDLIIVADNTTAKAVAASLDTITSSKYGLAAKLA